MLNIRLLALKGNNGETSLIATVFQNTRLCNSIANELNKRQIGLILEVATFLYGKDKFTKKQLTPFISEANVWFVLEKLRRTGLIRVDNKGVSHRTRLGIRVNKYMEKNEPKKAKARTIV